MSQSIALFGLTVKPGEIHRIPMVFRDFRITNISLGENVVGKKRVVVKVHHVPHYGHPAVEEGDAADESDEDEGDRVKESQDEDIEDALKSEKSYTERSFVLCTLFPGEKEQATVDLAFTQDEDIGFSVNGDNEVDLLGNYTTAVGADQPPYSDREDSDFYDSEVDGEIDSDEASKTDGDKDDDDSNYESDGLEMDGLDAILAERDSGEEDEDEDEEESEDSKIEEVGDAPLGSSTSQKKRKAAEKELEIDSDISMTAPVADSELAKIAAAEGLGASKLSKAQGKRLNKKLKSADDAADASVPSASRATPTSRKKTVKVAAVENGKAKIAAKETGQKCGKQTSQITKLPSGLLIEVKKEGSGPGAKKGAKVGMRYIGKLASNGKVFDSNTKGKPFSFKLGRGEVIKAWDEGVAGIKVGEERRLTCPPSIAYGSRGAPPDIPGNSTLVFDIKCVSI